MIIQAQIRHHIDGRVRLQFDKSTYQKIIEGGTLQELRSTAGISRVSPQNLSRTLLVQAPSEGLLQAGLKQWHQKGLMELEELPKPSDQPSWKQQLTSLRRRSDHVLKDMSDGALDSSSAAALLLIGLGLRQMALGSVLPAGLTLLMYAAGALKADSLDRSGDDQE